jgi:Family of unknown function (DUF5706)
LDTEIAAKQLDRTLGFFARVESKASFLFAVDSAMLGVLALNLQKEDFSLWLPSGSAGLSAALLLASLFFVYRCTFPSLKGGHASLVYFREIAKMREAEYISAFKALSPAKLTDDFISQTWRNSEILAAKFDYMKIAFMLTASALVPWCTFLVFASVVHSHLPVLK